MARTEQRRQKQLAKKKSKQIAKQKARVQERQELSSMAGRMRVAARGMVERCLVSEEILSGSGIGSVLISRRMPNGELAVAKFLIDGRCLGVKNCDAFFVMKSDLDDYVERAGEVEPLVARPPEYGRKLVEEAVAYAQQFDLKPHADYAKLQAIWGDIDSSQCAEQFRFGDDEGKPMYMSGPDDEPFFQDMVMRKLAEHVGEGNYHFVQRIGPELASQLQLDGMLTEEFEEEDDEDDGVVLDGEYRRIEVE